MVKCNVCNAPKYVRYVCTTCVSIDVSIDLIRDKRSALRFNPKEFRYSEASELGR